MTVTTHNLINARLAETVDSDIQKLAALFEKQQVVENRRKVDAVDQPRRDGALRKFLRG